MVVSDFHKCDQWVKKLKTYQGKYLMAQHQNQNQVARTIVTKKHFCGKSTQHDAVQYYSKKILDLKKKIITEERE